MVDIRMNYHADVEALINKQVNMELYASYVYMSMGHWFSRHDQALPGFAGFFKKNSTEEREHATLFMDYQISRGGKVLHRDINKPPKDAWSDPLEAVEDALALEKSVNQALLCLHAKASEVGDAHLTNFLEEKFLDEQVTAIKELGDLITQLKRVGSGLGHHIIDLELAKKN